MKLGSSTSHADASPLEHLEKPSFTPRPSIDGTTGTPKHSEADTFGGLLKDLPGPSGASTLLRSLLGSGQQEPQTQDGTAGGSGGGGLGALAKTAGETALGAIPVVGNVMSGVEALRAMSKGDFRDALLDGVESLPGVGNAVKLAAGVAKIA